MLHKFALICLDQLCTFWFISLSPALKMKFAGRKIWTRSKIFHIEIMQEYRLLHIQSMTGIAINIYYLDNPKKLWFLPFSPISLLWGFFLIILWRLDSVLSRKKPMQVTQYFMSCSPLFWFCFVSMLQISFIYSWIDTRTQLVLLHTWPRNMLLKSLLTQCGYISGNAILIKKCILEYHQFIF